MGLRMLVHHTKTKGDLERFFRVQVKYRAAVNGQIAFPLATCWADKHGTHTVPIDKSSIDLLCVYCPDTRTCYYVDPHRVRKSVVLRIEPPRNFQKKNITWAHECTDIPPTVLGLPPGSRRGLEDSAIVGQSSLSFERP